MRDATPEPPAPTPSATTCPHCGGPTDALLKVREGFPPDDEGRRFCHACLKVVPPASAPAATAGNTNSVSTGSSLGVPAPTGEEAETLHAAASDLRHVANGGSCAPETLLAHADALLAQATALAALRARETELRDSLTAMVGSYDALYKHAKAHWKEAAVTRVLDGTFMGAIEKARAALAPRQPTGSQP